MASNNGSTNGSDGRSWYWPFVQKPLFGFARRARILASS